jgi:hypothetical protein
VLNSCRNETSGSSQLYHSDLDFIVAYQTLGGGTRVEKFHLLDGLLCQLGHLYVPSSERVKLIWEAHYSRVERHFGMEKTFVVLQKYFFWSNIREVVNGYMRS